MNSNFWITLVIVTAGLIYLAGLIYYSRMLFKSSRDHSMAIREQTEAMKQLTKAIIRLPSSAEAIETERELKDRLTAEQAKAQRRILRD
jgi:uncharacterized membrane protein